MPSGKIRELFLFLSAVYVLFFITAHLGYFKNFFSALFTTIAYTTIAAKKDRLDIVETIAD